jgi:hypothetical protein
MSEIWSSLLRAVKRRNMLLQFAENPHKFMHHILTHPYEDTQERFLEMYELADTKNEYYSQVIFFSCMKKIFIVHNIFFSHGSLMQFKVIWRIERKILSI